MEITLSNGKSHFYQWDTGQSIQVPEGVPTVHFKMHGEGVAFQVVDRMVAVPDELLQLKNDIILWTYDTNHTIDVARIPVKKRNKPADYAYTPTEVKTWEQLDERIKALEKGGGVAGVSSINGQTGDVEITAKGLGALTEDDLQIATNAALAQAKASGEFDGPQGPKGDTGTDGKSAYQYAQDGGYTGTEADFTAKMAQEILSGTTDDLTPAQVYAAVSDGRPVKVQYTSDDYGVLLFTAFNVAETMSVIASQSIVVYRNEYVLAELYGNIKSGGWAFSSTTLAEKKDIPTVPSSMKNPHALTIKNGSNTVTYDGSSAQIVDMGSGEKWEKIADVALTADVSTYQLANFGQYRKVKVLISRSSYVSGINKNVWFRIRSATDEIAVTYIAAEYGYIASEINAEMGDMFTHVGGLSTNNRQSAQSPKRTIDVVSPTSQSEYWLYMLFTDTSVIQPGDTVAVYGVKR